METIFGLLVILLPLIFKLIGKKLEQAGNLEKAKRFQELAERMTSDSDEDSKRNTIEVSEIDFNDAVKQIRKQNEDFAKHLQNLYNNYLSKTRDEAQKKLIENSQSDLRKIIAKSFNNDKYKHLFGKELIREELIDFLKDDVRRYSFS